MSSRDDDQPVRARADTPHGARPAALLAVRLSPADVGRRVSIRRRLDGSTLTDVVGRLRSWTGGWAGELVVQRRDGTTAAVPAMDLVAGKVVPPELSAEALQAVAETGWPPEETARLGDWTLRAAGGVTGRANSVRVAGRPGVPVPDALATVRRWYADRDLPPLLQVPVPSAYDADLEELGWVVTRRTVLLTAATADVLTRAGARPGDGPALTRTPAPSAEWLALVEPDLDPEVLARILGGPREVAFLEARDEATGALLGTGRVSAAPSAVGRWAGITSIMTAPAARRRGVATRLVGELASWAAGSGCPQMYLQVLAENDAALALYTGLGFAPHHRYEYRSPTR